MMVSPLQRFSKARPCPVCGGYDRLPRGAGNRCFGFLSGDGRVAHCTRQEFAGALERNPGSQAFAHRLSGPCGCGQTHCLAKANVAARAEPAQATEQSWGYWSRDGEAKLFQVCRYEGANGKGYGVRRPAPADWRSCEHRDRCRAERVVCREGWIGTLKARPCSPAVAPVLYNLPLLRNAAPDDPVILAEGEQCADALCDLGFIATTNPFGAGAWQAAYSEELTGRQVVVFVDADEPGRNHGQHVARSLWGKASSIRLLDLYPDRNDGCDVANWIAERKAAGQSDESIRAELEALVAEAPEWQPEGATVGPPTSPPARGGMVGGEVGGAGLPEFNFAALRQRAEEEGFALDFLPFLGQADVRLICLKFSTLIAAYPKGGKTTLLFVLVCQWAAMGYRILFLTEEPELVWMARVAAAEEAGLDRIVGIPGLGVDPALLLQRAADGSEDVVIVDTTNLLGIQDGNDSATVWAALAPWVEMARTTGKTLIFAHHTNKGISGDLKAVAGSYNFAAIVDCVLVLRPDESPNRRVLGGASRVFTVEPIVCELDDSEMRCLGHPQGVALDAVAAACVETLAASPGTRLKTAEIRSAMSDPRPSLTQVQDALNLAAQRGEILRDPPVEEGKRPGATYRWWVEGGQTSPPTSLPLVGGEVGGTGQGALPMTPAAGGQ